MFKFETLVPANEIWPTASAPVYKGVKSGLCTGWCVEVTTWKGETYWRSCTFGWGSPEEIFNDDFWTWHWEDAGTGDVTFLNATRMEGTTIESIAESNTID